MLYIKTFHMCEHARDTKSATFLELNAQEKWCLPSSTPDTECATHMSHSVLRLGFEEALICPAALQAQNVPHIWATLCSGSAIEEALRCPCCATSDGRLPHGALLVVQRLPCRCNDGSPMLCNSSWWEYQGKTREALQGC